MIGNDVLKKEDTVCSQQFLTKILSWSTFWKNISQRVAALFLKIFLNKLFLGNEERALAVRSSVFDHLPSKSCDAKQVVHKLQETLEWKQSSLKQPNLEDKKWIRCLAREAKRSDRLDVVKYLREITPAGTTGKCVFCSLPFTPSLCREYSTVSSYLFKLLLHF